MISDENHDSTIDSEFDENEMSETSVEDEIDCSTLVKLVKIKLIWDISLKMEV